MIENMVQTAKLTVKANVFIVRTDMRLPLSVMATFVAPARVGSTGLASGTGRAHSSRGRARPRRLCNQDDGWRLRAP
jgi:hypothetical protein